MNSKKFKSIAIIFCCIILFSISFFPYEISLTEYKSEADNLHLSSQTSTSKPNEVLGKTWLTSSVEKLQSKDNDNNHHSGNYEYKEDMFGMSEIDDVDITLDYPNQIGVHIWCRVGKYGLGYAKLKCAYRIGGGSWNHKLTVSAPSGGIYTSTGWIKRSFYIYGGYHQHGTDELQIKLTAHIECSQLGGWIDVDEVYAEINYDTSPDDTLPWGVDHIDADKVWNGNELDDGDDIDIVPGRPAGQGINLCIIELLSGIDLSHNDLIYNYKGGIDYSTSPAPPDDDPQDTNGHGTAIAGIIGARDSYEGIIGVAPRVNIYVVRIGNVLLHLGDAIEWAWQNEMDIISMSIGGPEPIDGLEAVLNHAYSVHGIVLVAGVGNFDREVFYPAKYSNVIAVGAIEYDETSGMYPRWDPDGADGSNYGPELDFVAPGVDIYSTNISGEFSLNTGTSFACPHVAAVYALILSLDPDLTPSEVKQRLIDSARDMIGDDDDTYGFDIYYGYGLIDAYGAVFPEGE